MEDPFEARVPLPAIDSPERRLRFAPALPPTPASAPSGDCSPAASGPACFSSAASDCDSSDCDGVAGSTVRVSHPCSRLNPLLRGSPASSPAVTFFVPSPQTRPAFPVADCPGINSGAVSSWQAPHVAEGALGQQFHQLEQSNSLPSADASPDATSSPRHQPQHQRQHHPADPDSRGKQAHVVPHAQTASCTITSATLCNDALHRHS